MCVYFVTAEVWRDHPTRQVYGEVEATPGCDVAMCWSEPADERHIDHGVFSVTHVRRGAPASVAQEIAVSLVAMMDDKLGAEFWRPGGFFVQDDRPPT